MNDQHSHKNTSLEEQILARIYDGDLNDTDFPLVEPPPSLRIQLYRIADRPNRIIRRFRWPALAASLIGAVTIGFQVAQYQHRQVQFETAKRELATALYYLNEANQKANESIQATLKASFEKSAVNPIFRSTQHIHSS